MVDDPGAAMDTLLDRLVDVLSGAERGRLARRCGVGVRRHPAAAERMRAADRQARAVWSRVEMPPGADQITF